jgi:hypothetical protein
MRFSSIPAATVALRAFEAEHGAHVYRFAITCLGMIEVEIYSPTSGVLLGAL